VAGCDSLFATPVKKILDNPREYHGKTVTVRGEVKEVVGLLVIRYFVIDDGTASIPVITHKPLPVKGSKLTVKGAVTEAVALGDRQYLVIMEDGEKR
jgi:hypothetical protein